MRISDIRSWVECETYALHHPYREPPRVHVAAYVGTCAHGLLAGQTIEQIAEEHPSPLIFDRRTMTKAQAHTQAQEIAGIAETALRAQNWLIVEQEVAVSAEQYVGHLDLRCWKEGSGDAIVDLKTGQLVSTGWLQVGGYLSAAEYADWGGILHVPRESPHKVTLTLRPAKPLINEWTQWRKRIAEIESGAAPRRSPGLHCSRCPLTTCPVRTVV